MQATSAIVLDAVGKQYGGPMQPVTALCDVSLDIPVGQFVSVMGPSGCGKSTLLNLIAGIDTPNSGRVVLLGHDLSHLSDDARSALRLRHVGFVYQNFNLFPSFSVEENVTWPVEFLGVRWREARQRAAVLLEQVGVPAAAHARRPAELSGGEQQRVAIARALIAGPQLLLADEPTGNSDSRTGREILDLLRMLNVERQLTIVLVTHDTRVATYGHRTVELRDGRVDLDIQAPPHPAPRPLRAV